MSADEFKNIFNIIFGFVTDLLFAPINLLGYTFSFGSLLLGISAITFAFFLLSKIMGGDD